MKNGGVSANKGSFIRREQKGVESDKERRWREEKWKKKKTTAER